MKVKDKILKVMVDVCESDCQLRKCYWARPNPGIFNQGQGYKKFGDSRDKEYLCGNREIKGCPDKPEYNEV